jgi:hypothetical protein
MTSRTRESALFEGPAACRAFSEDYWGSFDDRAFDVEEILVLDRDQRSRTALDRQLETLVDEHFAGHPKWSQPGSNR